MHTYTLSLEDVVTYNQYNLSIKKKNVFQKLRIVASVYFVLLGVLFIYVTNYIIGGIFILFGLLYPLLGAKYVKWAYTKTFRKVILTDCSGLINAPNTFSVADNKIVIQDQGGIFYYNLSAVESINEIATHFFIKFNNSDVTVVPKTETELAQTIRTLITEHNLRHVVQLNWKY
ncbi:hypothetical protein HQN86_19380 [Pedobacter panaciterrae]|jgi:hypothetical protein|uniref:hypothetical protein n=1 Tax=Pedobacter panaciterrae TaxID=363849 RepID=UPI00155DDD3E|nr:hypothetical protein [Pedobacter panaciterrae]NQX55793.1 hypothetical protein [Pedobacter panaciterrae]